MLWRGEGIITNRGPGRIAELETSAREAGPWPLDGLGNGWVNEKVVGDPVEYRSREGKMLKQHRIVALAL